MLSFLHYVSSPAVQQVSEKGLFGKTFVRLGKLYFTIGYWVFHQGAVLGYSLKDHPTLLGKFLPRIDPEFAVEYIYNLRTVITGHLTKSEGHKRDFAQLYTIREFRELGIDIMAQPWPPSKTLNTKMNEEAASNIMVRSFHEGVAFGYHFPEIFKECWENTYRIVPDDEWQEARAYGLQISGTQEKRPLSTAIAEIAELALCWMTEDAPHLFSHHEIQLLRNLATST